MSSIRAPTYPAFHKVMRENPEAVSRLKKKFTLEDHQSVAESAERLCLDIMLYELLSETPLTNVDIELFSALEEGEVKEKNRKRVRKIK